MWRAYHAFGIANYNVGYGILKYISELLNKFDSSNIIVCWDDGKSKWRTNLYPEYKVNRNKKKEGVDFDELGRQVESVIKYLEYFNIRSIMVNGVEADDLISWLTEYHLSLSYNVTIITGDKDLWQLINENVIVYDHLRDRMVNREFVKENLGVEPENIIDYKSLAGDVSDNIKGIKGIGCKIAVKLINEYGTIGKLLDLENVSKLSKSRRTMKILEQVQDIELAYKLVKLPILKEASYYLEYEEYSSICECLSREPVKNDFRLQLLKEKLKNFQLNQEKILPLSSDHFKGMLMTMQKKEQEEYPSLASLDMSIKSCTRCGMANDCVGYGPTLPEGYNDVEIMIIGRNPEQNKTSEVSERFDKFLEDIGLTRRDVWVTNVNKCCSKHDRPPTYGEVKTCSEFLKAEIKLIKPKLIIAFGTEAMSMITSYKDDVVRHCGEILYNSKGSVDILGDLDTKVAICVRPSYALKSEKGEKNMQFATYMLKKFMEEMTC